MHIPDGFIGDGTAVGLIGAAMAAVSVAFHKVRASFLEKVPVLRMKLATFPPLGEGEEMSIQSRLSDLGRRKAWRLAAVGALIFAAQMVNFPVAHGTSGHLLGGVLAALIAGPWEALLVMSAILGVQAVIFGDGGIVALGANVFNMGIVGALGGWVLFRFFMRGRAGRRGFLESAFAAAWISVVLTSVVAAVEIAISGTEPIGSVLPAMALVHVPIGIMEGVITVAVLSALVRRGFPIAALSKEMSSYEKE